MNQDALVAQMVQVLHCALADLEGLLEIADPDGPEGDAPHSGWVTQLEIQNVLKLATGFCR